MLESHLQTATVYGSRQPLDLLCLAPHPDDAEIGAGGTLIKAAAGGQAVGILELSQGELGTLGTPEQRIRETQAAAQVMQLAWRGNIGLPDGAIGLTESHALQLAHVLRQTPAQTILIPHPLDRHPDHRNSYHLAIRAIHLAGLSKAAVEGTPHKIKRVLTYQGNYPFEASLLVDVSAHIERWEAAVLCHHSQFGGIAVSETVSPEIIERRKARMMYWGTFVGTQYAEGFGSELPWLWEF